MRAVIIGLVGFALLTAGGTVFLVKRLLDTPTVIADEVDEEVVPVFNVFVLVQYGESYLHVFEPAFSFIKIVS